jgi:hypothetical protein
LSPPPAARGPSCRCTRLSLERLEARWLYSLGPIGPEFRVNMLRGGQ